MINKADILVGGGAAGVGKTFVLLLDPAQTKYMSNKGWGAVTFRRTMPQIKNEGGLWDASMKVYPTIGGDPKDSKATWTFPSGIKFKYSHLEYEKNVYDYQGAEIPYIGFDELTHFSSKMFWYLLSRNRSTCGISPRVRGTCNPDPDSFLVNGKDGWGSGLISWWIGEDGYPIEERSGKLRYLFKDGDNYVWGNTKKEIIKQAEDKINPIVEASDGLIKETDLIKSVSFIPGSIYQNKKLLETNPQYLANLLAQDEAERTSLLEGNWKVRISEDDLINYDALLDSFSYESISDNRDKYITADIALEGSDKLVFIYWEGYIVQDILIEDKAGGKEVIEKLDAFMKKHSVRGRQVSYDDDGVGKFIGGFIKTTKRFNNGSKALNNENYFNLKTQCSYIMARMINEGHVEFSDRVLEAKWDNTTVKARLIQERKAIKKYKPDHEGKKRMLPKPEMKRILNGSSPDIWDALLQRAIFDLKPKIKSSGFYSTA